MGDNYSGKRESNIFRNKGVRNLVLTLCGLVLFLLSMNGVIENSIGRLLRIERVSESSQEFLEKSLVTATGHFISLSAIKGGLYVIRDTSIFGVSVGKIVSPLSDTINFIWKLFGWAMLLIVGQIGGGLSEGVNILVRNLVGYLGNLMIMFVITPFFFYGVVYCLIKRILSRVGISFNRRSIQNV